MPVALVPRKLDGRIREALEHAIARYDAGQISSVAIVTVGADEIGTTYVGDAISIVYALERLKLELLTDGD